MKWDDGSESGYLKAVRVHPLTSSEAAERARMKARKEAERQKQEAERKRRAEEEEERKKEEEEQKKAAERAAAGRKKAEEECQAAVRIHKKDFTAFLSTFCLRMIPQSESFTLRRPWQSKSNRRLKRRRQHG